MDSKTLQLKDFPRQTFDKLRFADTDQQGHVNNAIFSTFLETGRVEFLYNNGDPLHEEGASFVIASLHLDFLREIKWPGQVETGTGILRLGNSSIKIFQKIFQHGQTVATAETVIVQVSNHSGQSMPLSARARETLGQWILPE